MEKLTDIEEAAYRMAGMIRAVEYEKATEMMTNLLKRYDIKRREANAGYQLLKGVPICMKAWDYIVDANYVNISWGPGGTPEGVATEFVRSVDAIASGESKPLTDEELSKL